MTKRKEAPTGYVWATDTGDPRLLTNGCNDGMHRHCTGIQCDCYCHTRVHVTKVKPGPKSDQTFMEAYGVIDI